jgi:hypothetical protein
LGVIFCFTSTVLSFRVFLLGDLTIIIPIVFVTFGALNTWLLFTFTGQVLITENAVVQTKFRNTTRIPFHQITKLENQLFNARLIIHSDKNKIVVEKQMQNFEYFYFLLMDRVPKILHAAQLQLPILVKVQKFIVIFSIVFAGLGAFFLFLSIRDSADIGAYVFSLGLLGMGLAAIILAPRSYWFNSDGIRVSYLFRQKQFRWIDLELMDLVKTSRGIAQSASILKFEFVNGKLQIPELASDQPLEELMKAILLVLKRYKRGEGSHQQNLLE